MLKLCAGDVHCPIRVEVYDWDGAKFAKSTDDLIGAATLTVHEIFTAGVKSWDLINPRYAVPGLNGIDI